ncbi:MAG: adenylate/guanylate cyclase domain-containing protein [Cyanobacteria bacterium]|nr:adenylate/guanylate cyclase domain-containing protein [Cyanobacteriota bacterium]
MVSILIGPIDNIFQRLEMSFLSMRQRLVSQPRTDKGIAIVGIDDVTASSADMKRLFGRFPYRRDLYPYLIRFINRAKSKVLIFDMSFDGGEDLDYPDRDKAFFNSIQASRVPLISGLMTRYLDKNDRLNAEDQLPESFWENRQIAVEGASNKVGILVADTVIPPIRLLQNSKMKFYPFQSLWADINGVTRLTIPLIGFRRSNAVMPSLSLGAIMTQLPEAQQKQVIIDHTGDILLGKLRLETHNNTYPIIRWYGDARGQKGGMSRELRSKDKRYWTDKWLQFNQLEPKSQTIYPQLSLWNVLASEIQLECAENKQSAACALKQKIHNPYDFIPPGRISNHYVFFGQTMMNAPNPDIHQTIYNGANYPGVFIQANILDNYLNNDFTQYRGKELTFFLCLMMGVLGVDACLRWRSALMSVTFFIALNGVFIMTGMYLYREHNIWINMSYPLFTLISTYLLSFMLGYVDSEKQKQQLRFAFAKYVSPGVMQTIEKNPSQVQLGGQRRVLTTLFCDIRAFTSFSEEHTPEDVQTVLSQYFSVMNHIVLNQYQGSVNKLMGDALMAYWGFPLERQDHAYLAVCAALDMKDAIEKWSLDPNNPPLRIGIGVNTGEVFIGNVGSEQFMDFTVVGDAVNIASRLEDLNKQYGTTIIISKDTYQRVEGRVVARELGSIRVRGKEQETEIYELISHI